MSPRARFILIAGLLAFAAVSVRLGIWQLHRLAERRTANAAAAAARAAPELDLAVRAGAAPAERRVRATGVYDRTHELVLRGRALRDVPGVAVVTPLRLAGSGDTAALVERGFLPVPDAVTLPPDSGALDEPGTRTVHGVALPIPSASDSGAPLDRAGRTTWARLDLAALRRRLPYPILDVYIQQTPDSALPRLPRRREPPAVDDEGPHMNYALQWFGFAATAVVFAGIFATKGRVR
ncbi:MAG TPA: SURF1 family protein [Gemmatimonadales bacterium]|nr:SURF1 family protein [Gemmatimonadales bacterium]